MKDILIENCNFKQNTVDEIVSSWGKGTVYNVRVLNSTITEENDDNKVMSINFRDNTTNTYLENNTFNINGKIKTFISLTNSNKNNYVLNNTFNINVDNVVAQHKAIGINKSNTKILGNTFNSSDKDLDYIIEQVDGNVIFNDNYVNDCCNGIAVFTRESTNGNIIISNNKIKTKMYVVRISNSTNNISKINNNIITLTNTSDITTPLYFTRQAGESTGSYAYLENNSVEGTNIAIIYGVGASNSIVRNNNIKAATLDIIKRSDETYSIGLNTTIFENNNLMTTTLNDLVNITTSATTRIFNNNYINGSDITNIPSGVTPANSSYPLLFRRIVPTNQILYSSGSSILGYRKMGDTDVYTTINIQ